MDVEAVMMVITTREMVGEVEMGVNNVLGMVGQEQVKSGRKPV
jgi:hypothetical protein